jgi:hypothetical protein
MPHFRYSIYGLLVDSDRPLFRERFARPYAADLRADLVILHSDTEIESRSAATENLLLDLKYEDAEYFCEHRADGGYNLVFAEACEMSVSPDLSMATVIRHRDAVPGIEDVLASGAFMAWQLYMRGVLVLHASAIQVDDRAIAFVAGSGGGKSTMATIMSAAGGRVITDDLLAIDFIDGQPHVRLGSSELRLRKGADELAEAFESDSQPDRRITADSRQVVEPGLLASDGLRLSAIFVPVPDRESAEVGFDRVSASDALFALLRTPRLFGWLDESVRRTQFELTSLLVKIVPLTVAHIPWGPPFAPEIAPSIVAELNEDRAPRRLRFQPAPS